MASSVRELLVTLEHEVEELAVRREELERDLAETEAQLEARRQAVAHLALIRPLTTPPRPRREATPPTPLAQPPKSRAGLAAADGRPASERRRDATPHPRARSGAARTASTPAAATNGAARPKAPRDAKPTPVPAGPRARGRLREELAAVLAAADEPMNVRRLTEALGENPTKSRMENVRTTTEALVRNGRAAKAGRGLFTRPAT